MYVCMYECFYVFMFVCVYACLCMYVFLAIYTKPFKNPNSFLEDRLSNSLVIKHP